MTQTFTVSISINCFEKLRWLANYQHIAATSALEKAIETEWLLQQEIMKGKRIIMVASDKTLQEIIFN